MADVLNNATTANGFTDPATATFQFPTNKLALIIANNAVYMNVLVVPAGMRVGGGTWGPDEYMIPGVYSQSRRERVGGVRFKNATAGLNAQVSARAS